jgi:hypothetical protein
MTKPKTRGEAAALIRTELARRDLASDQIDRGVALALPRLGEDGTARRVSGEPVALSELVEVIVAAVAPAASTSPDVAPQAPTPLPDYLQALRARLTAQRAAAASAQVHNIQGVVDRMQSPLDRIDAGR